MGHLVIINLNPRGICSLSPSSTNGLLAFPAPDTGKVQLVDLANTEKPARFISAHEAKLCCVTLNIPGTRIATASDKVSISTLCFVPSVVMFCSLCEVL